jgi:hypothetical protein
LAFAQERLPGKRTYNGFNNSEIIDAVGINIALFITVISFLLNFIEKTFYNAPCISWEGASIFLG